MTFTDYDIRTAQRPLKDRYRADPTTARVTLRAVTSDEGAPIACQLDLGHGQLPSEAHVGVGGPGTAPARATCCSARWPPARRSPVRWSPPRWASPSSASSVTAEGDLDLRGTLGVARDVPIGFEAIRLRLDIVAPDATEEQLRGLREKTEQYCVVMQTLQKPPSVTTEWG